MTQQQQQKSIQGISLLLLLSTLTLLLASLQLPCLIHSSPTVAHYARLHPSLSLLISVGLKALDGSVCLSFALFVVGTVWECLPEGSGAPKWGVVPAYVMTRGPMMELIRVAKSVEVSMLLLFTFFSLLLLVQLSIRLIARLVKLAHSIGKGAYEVGEAVWEALGRKEVL